MNVTMLVVQGRPAGKCLHFPLGEYYFGRGAECQVRPNSEWVSRQHCLLRVTETEAYLRDLGSRNGTLVNGELLHEERPLRHGDQVQVGPLVFEIQLQQEIAETRGAIAPLLDGLEPPTTATRLEAAEDMAARTLPTRRKSE
ncbi:MAG TPA: FHA domain-containing protein [Gemmataceae bacterium]|jgi:predicted component of type VI protein secretion system